VLVSAEIEIYLAPNGGFSKRNSERTVIMKDGTKVPATLNNTLIQLIESTEDGGIIKIAMYSFSYKPVQEALLDAGKRGIKVKLILDASAEWTKDIRKEFCDAIFKETEKAKQENKVFDFQVKEILPKAMMDRGRFKREPDLLIIGTMHEKFGIFFPKGCKIPLNGFCGSANVSGSASDVYGENRVIFHNEPSMGRQLAEEFARLWNEYSSPVTENCQSESFIPSTTDLTEVQIISNSKPLDEENMQRIDTYLIKMMEQVNRQGGTIDIAIFSFTHEVLANKLLELAENYPNIKIRLLMDLNQMELTESNPGILGPYLLKAVEFKGLTNFEIRFKWRSNAFAWDPQKGSGQLIHFRNPLLHHKAMIVNRSKMAIGSYNWSSSAEYRNFENVMLFHGDVPEHQKIIDCFLAEFDLIWGNLKDDKAITARIDYPQVVTGPQGRKLKAMICKAFDDPDCRKIMEALDGRTAGVSEPDLVAKTGLSLEKIQEKTAALVQTTLIFKRVQDGVTIYQAAD